MKKMMNIIIMLMLVVSITSLALAEEADDNPGEGSEFEGTNENNGNETEDPSENETEDPDLNETEDPIDNETEREIEIMNYSLGAEIRLLQLEKSITKNLLKGEMAVDVLEGLGYNTSDLETILEELELVLEQVKNADPNASDAVEIFVGLKNDSRNITKQFRDMIRDLVSGKEYKQLKEQIRENITGIQEYNKQIRNRIKQFNRNQMYRLYGIIGEENNSFVNKYMNGTMNLSSVKLQLNKMVNIKAKEKKKEIFEHMKKENIQNQACANGLANMVKANFTERKQERLQERLEKANETGNEKLMEKIQEKIQENQNIPNNPGKGNSTSENGKGKGKGNGK